MNSLTCGTCRYWKYDVTSEVDRQHAKLGRRFCGLANDHISRARSFAAHTPRCRQHSLPAKSERKGEFEKRINGLYAILRKNEDV